MVVRHMFKGHRRKSITVKMKINCLCYKDTDGKKGESDSLSSFIFYCVSLHLHPKKLFWNLGSN